MKKFQFSLQRMLNYKNTLLDREKDRLHALHAQRQAAEQGIANAEEQLLAVDKDLKEGTARSMSASEARQRSFTIENTRRLLEQRRLELAAIQSYIQQQTAVVLEISKEVSGLEKLEEKQRSEYNYEANREETERILEVVSNRYIADQPK